MMANLLAYFCEGSGQRFHGTCCEDYDASSGECRLLRGKPLAEVFRHGRCQPFEMLKRAVRKQLMRYHDLVTPGDHTEAMTFEIAQRLYSKELTQGFKIYVLKGYINRAAYTGVTELLQKETHVVRRRCGECRYLSQSTPYSCQRTTLLRDDGIEIAHPWYQQPRKFSENACDDGFEPVENVSTEEFLHPPAGLIASEPEHGQLLLHDLLKLLATRAEQASSRTLQRKYDRHYSLFCKLLDLFAQGIPRRDALKEAAVCLGNSVRTIDYDLQEIREFFKQEGGF